MNRTVVVFASLAFALGLVLLVMSAVSVEAQSSADTALPPVTNTDGRAGACYTFYPGPDDQPRYYLPMAVDAWVASVD